MKWLRNLFALPLVVSDLPQYTKTELEDLRFEHGVHALILATSQEKIKVMTGGMEALNNQLLLDPHNFKLLTQRYRNERYIQDLEQRMADAEVFMMVHKDLINKMGW